MNSDTLYRTLFLLENDIARLDEAVDAQKISTLTSLIPSSLVQAIEQAGKQKDEHTVLSLINGWIKTDVGANAKASSLDDAIKKLTKEKSEITSITNMLIKASVPQSSLEGMTNIEKRRLLNTVAEKNGIDTKGKNLAEITSGLSNVLATKKSGQTSTQNTSADFNRTKNGPAPLEPFPGKRQLFIQSYNKTLALGWPGEPIKVSKKDGEDVIEQQVSGKLIPFNVGAKTGVKLTNAIPGTKVLPNWIKTAKTLVYNKFKQDPHGLKKLLDAVNDIIEKNKNYKLSRRIGFRDTFKSIGNSFLAKFGASDKDLAVFNWLVTKAVGMDIFEFQKLIIEDVMSAIDMSDDRIAKMENVAKGLKKMMESDAAAAKYQISPLKSVQDWNGYKVWYDIKTTVKPATKKTITDPMSFYLTKLKEYAKSASGKKWTEIPSEKDIQNELIKINDYVISKKNDEYTYDVGEDGPLSCVDEEKRGDTLVGEQIMYPVFMGRNGLRLYVVYNPERTEK